MSSDRVPPHRGGSRSLSATLLPAVVVVSVFCAGWVAFRVITRDRPADPVVAEKAPAAKPVVDSPVRSVGSPDPVDGMPAPLAADADPSGGESAAPMPVTPPADEPPIDDIVKKEGPNYAPEKPATGKLEPVRLTPVVPPAGGMRDPQVVAAEIDRIIDAALAAAKTPASPPADDAEFLRRAYLDLTGTIPPVAKVRAFLDDPSPGKRAALVDELLTGHDFGEHFAQYWHELLVKRDPDNNTPIQTHDVFVKWLTRQFHQNRPWDEVVRTMLTAGGDPALAGETFFVLANSENGQPAANKIVGTAAALFLGNQLQCAECHVHPIVPGWSQQDFWGLAAFFGRTHAATGAKMPAGALARIVEGPAGKGGVDGTLPDGSIPIPDPRNEGKVIGAARGKLFGEGFRPVPAASVNRAFAADWFISPRNPFFPRATVNRLWSQFFARGIINPLDDIRPDSHPTHPELLELLAAELVGSKFDVKHMIRCFCRSAAYQRSSRTTQENKDDTDHYSHMLMKVIPPRALFASLAVVTGDQLRAPKGEPGTRKMPPVGGLAFFDTREYDESPAEYTYGVPHLLRLMNTQLPPACDAVARSVAKTTSREKAVEHLYLLALSRPPTPVETGRMTSFVAKHADPVKGYSAALWALLTSAEFMTNH